MFREMLEVDRDAAVAEYNAAQESDISRVPTGGDKRLPRHMIPFYAWLARKYWGEPDANEVFQFAIRTGAVSLNNPAS
jgi:hypothetical protein